MLFPAAVINLIKEEKELHKFSNKASNEIFLKIHRARFRAAAKLNRIKRRRIVIFESASYTGSKRNPGDFDHGFPDAQQRNALIRAKFLWAGGIWWYKTFNRAGIQLLRIDIHILAHIHIVYLCAIIREVYDYEVTRIQLLLA